MKRIKGVVYFMKHECFLIICMHVVKFAVDVEEKTTVLSYLIILLLSYYYLDVY